MDSAYENMTSLNFNKKSSREDYSVANENALEETKGTLVNNTTRVKGKGSEESL